MEAFLFAKKMRKQGKMEEEKMRKHVKILYKKMRKWGKMEE